MRIRTGLVLGVLLALGAAGCGGAGGDNDGVATAGTANPKASSSAAAVNKAADPDAMVKFAQCMRENGVNMPDPEGDGSKTTMTLPEGTDKEKVKAAQEKCKQYMPNGGQPVKPDAQQLEALRNLAKCMRDNGVPNFPDPSDEGGIMIDEKSGINPKDSTFQAAQKKCEKFQPAGPSGGPHEVHEAN